MKIGVISDTHGMLTSWRKAMRLFSGADIIIHAGDVLYHPPRLGPTEGYDVPGLVEEMNAQPTPIVIARGNCDPEVYEELLEMPALAPYAIVQHSGLRIVVQHGHTLSEKKMVRAIEKYHADILVTGHTHVPVLEKCGEGIHLNPGSPSLPKFECDGVLTATVAIISDDSIEVIALEDGRTLMSRSISKG
jgi:hypothetical protein